MSVRLINKSTPSVILKPLNIEDIKYFKVKNILSNGNIQLILLHLNTVFKNQKSVPMIEGTNNNEIIHCIAGLFDVCLPDMDLDTIYNSITDDEAYTIIAFMNEDQSREKLSKEVSAVDNKQEKIDMYREKIQKFSKESESGDGLDVFESISVDRDEFELIFESPLKSEEKKKTEEEEEEEEEEDDNYSEGFRSYMRQVYTRKAGNLIGDGDMKLGLDKRIVGAVSFKVRHVEVRRIVHITMIGVLPEFRCAGVGRRLLDSVLDRDVTGEADSVVVHADWSACEFFKKAGFSDDALLNLQWHELEPEYTNCSLLTLVPTYSQGRRHCASSSGGRSQLVDEFSAAEMEVDMRLWQKRSIENHVFQAHLFRRMQREIEQLKQTAKQQDATMMEMMKELRESNREKSRLEHFLKSNSKMWEKYQKEDQKQTVDTSKQFSELDTTVRQHFWAANMGEESGPHLVLRGLAVAGSLPPLVVAEHRALTRSHQVHRLTRGAPPQVPSIGPGLRVLYFCETFSTSRALKIQVLSQGFSRSLCHPGLYGVGLYFTSSLRDAVTVASEDCVLLAQVSLGSVYQATDPATCSNPHDTNCSRDSAPGDHHSVQLPRQPDQFVAFHWAQALPLALVDFDVSP